MTNVDQGSQASVSKSKVRVLNPGISVQLCARGSNSNSVGGCRAGSQPSHPGQQSHRVNTQHCQPQCNLTEHNAMQHNAMQYSAVQCNEDGSASCISQQGEEANIDRLALLSFSSSINFLHSNLTHLCTLGLDKTVPLFCASVKSALTCSSISGW